MASVVGREFGTDVLATASGVEPAYVVDHLEEALAISMLMAVPSTPGRYRFAHELVREVLYDELPTTRAMTLHRRVAEALESIYAAELDPHAAELAHHFAMAAPAGTAARSRPICHEGSRTRAGPARVRRVSAPFHDRSACPRTATRRRRGNPLRATAGSR